MRILLVSLTLHSHGASLVLLRIADLLAGEGHAISLLAIEGTRGELRTAYKARGIPIITGVRSHAFDLAICNAVASAPAVCAIARAFPVIWWLRETRSTMLRSPTEPSVWSAQARPATTGRLS